jgi:hypothetical protein
MSQHQLVPSERGLWAVEVYEVADGTQPFASWLYRLPDAKFIALDAAIRLIGEWAPDLRHLRSGGVD